jgi:N6-adenosine-specific RNA methylase IME4
VTDLAALAGEKFATIYADPPWRYSNRSSRGAAEDHYQTMSLEDIAALPVGDLAAEQAHLHLWTTTAFLFDAIGLLIIGDSASRGRLFGQSRKWE